MAKETYLHGKRDPFTWQKMPFYMVKETYYMAKETYLHGKRDLFTWRKRPIYMAKEAHLHSKRGLLILEHLSPEQTHERMDGGVHARCGQARLPQ